MRACQPKDKCVRPFTLPFYSFSFETTKDTAGCRASYRNYIVGGGTSLPKNRVEVTTTKHQIGKTTYFVCASPSDWATDSLDRKIRKLIKKDLEQSRIFDKQ